MTAKTLRSSARRVGMKQRTINRRKKIESSLISSENRIPRWRKLVILRNLQYKALADFNKKQAAIEEERFGKHDFVDREVPSIPFEERRFGHLAATDQGYFKTLAGDHVDLSSLVASLALFDGDKMLFACSGISIPNGRDRLRLSRFVTSACLVTKFKENRTRDANLRIEVRCPNNRIIHGLLGLYDQDIAIVTCVLPLSVRTLDQDLREAPEPDGNNYPVLAAGRTFTDGFFMSTFGSLDEEYRVALVSEISEAALGEPLIGVDDRRFLGMNLEICDGDSNLTTISFLPSKLLWQRLEHFQILKYLFYTCTSNISELYLSPVNFLCLFQTPVC